MLTQPLGLVEVSGRPYLGPGWAVQFGQMVSAFDYSGNSSGRSFLANHSGQYNIPATADPSGDVFLAGDLAMGPSEPIVHAALMYDGGGTLSSVRWGPQLLASAGVCSGSESMSSADRW